MADAQQHDFPNSSQRLRWKLHFNSKIQMTTQTTFPSSARRPIGGQPTPQKRHCGLEGINFRADGRLVIRNWRRRRDSNPRYAFGAYNGLANRRLQPLGHVSALVDRALIRSHTRTKRKIGTALVPQRSFRLVAIGRRLWFRSSELLEGPPLSLVPPPLSSCACPAKEQRWRVALHRADGRLPLLRDASSRLQVRQG
jgi:hypothetical protein